METLNNVLTEAESWLKKYLFLTFCLGSLIGSFFMEPALSSKVSIMLFTTLSVVEIQDIKEASKK